MNNQQYGILLVAAAVLALANRPALANVCDQPSPLHEQSGEQYWHGEFASENQKMPLESNGAVIKADSRQAQALFEVLELFDGRHYNSGEGVRYICKGAPHERRVVVFKSELQPVLNNKKQSVEQSLHFTETAENDEEKIGYLDRVIVDIPAADKWQVISDNTIATSLVFRRANALQFSMLKQIDTTLAKTRNGIQLTRTMYINGHRESWATWLLDK